MKYKLYEEWKALIEEHLLDFLPDVDMNSLSLKESMEYSLETGGKRVRPVLLLAACHFCGGEVISALPYACALEYIHTYSLIHDDLPAMDNDDLRRGKPTNHKVFGEDMAILAGDGLLNSAYEVMNKDMLLYLDQPFLLNQRVRAAYEISKGAGCRGMIAGQVADVEIEGKICSKELLDYIHLNKTAALLVAAVRAGAYLGGSNRQKLDDLTEYAECIGLAFQITDDLLDLFGDEAVVGKKLGVDQKLKKATFPALWGVENSREKLRELTDRAVSIMIDYLEDGEFFVDLARKLAVRIK